MTTYKELAEHLEAYFKNAHRIDEVIAILRSLDAQKPIGYWGGAFSIEGGADLYEVEQVSAFGRVYKNLPLYAAPVAAQPPSQPVDPVHVINNAAAETAWRAGWAACRDAEFAGQEAEDDEWGMNGANVCKDVESDLRAKNGGA